MQTTSTFRKLISVTVVIALALTAALIQMPGSHAASSTGVGLSANALRAYYEGWSYVYGGSSDGAVDCSGLIANYNGVGGSRGDMLGSSSDWGYISSGIPRIHGLGLHQPGHIGVYVGGGMAVDARDESSGICYQSVSSKSWVEWFKVAGVSYPSSGWVLFAGDSYYYENGEYLVSTSKTLNGITYTFSSSGASDLSPDDSAYQATDYSSSSAPKPTKPAGNSSKPTETAATQQSKALKNGSSGSEVTNLQQRLIELGFYDGEVTGYFGDVTEAAYRDFQTAAGVTVDGIAGESDLAILYSGSAPLKNKPENTTESADDDDAKKNNIEYKNGDFSEEITAIQSRLKELKYFNDEPTGYFGDLTEASVKAFQKANGLDETGIADSAMLAKLNSDSAVAAGSGASGDDAGNQQETTESAQETTAETTTQSATDPAGALLSSQGVTKPYELNTEVLALANSETSEALAGAIQSPFFNDAVDTGGAVTWLWIAIGLAVTCLAFFAVYINEKRRVRLRRVRARINSKRYW